METVVTFLLIIGAIFLVSFLAGRNNEKTMRERCFRAWDKSFGKVPAKKMSPQRFEHIGGYEKRHRGTFTIDDITWNDLDMDQVYPESMPQSQLPGRSISAFFFEPLRRKRRRQPSTRR